jgi:hypothetical protein
LNNLLLFLLPVETRSDPSLILKNK